MIDPGHGGKDPGAIGIGGLREKDVILPISQQVAALLQQQGIQAVMTRSDDRFISLEGRVQMARQARATLFVSIHANSLSLRRPDVNGVETYYFSSQRLAQEIHYSMLQSLNVRDRGVRRARFYVLRNNSIPAVLVEVGYVTGAGDAPKLASPAFQRQMAEAIARGILLYIRQNF
jgi:N-acetylmuramoyl-L-alanine amidase